jgi:hypothetical protein
LLSLIPTTVYLLAITVKGLIQPRKHCSPPKRGIHIINTVKAMKRRKNGRQHGVFHTEAAYGRLVIIIAAARTAIAACCEGHMLCAALPRFSRLTTAAPADQLPQQSIFDALLLCQILHIVQNTLPPFKAVNRLNTMYAGEAKIVKP